MRLYLNNGARLCICIVRLHLYKYSWIDIMIMIIMGIQQNEQRLIYNV